MLKNTSNKKLLITVIAAVILYSFFRVDIAFVPIEELSISSAIGIDVIKGNENDKMQYMVSVLSYISENDKVDTIVRTGVGDSVSGTRENRRLKSDDRFLLGLERIVISSEEMSRFGIRNWVDPLFSNRNINDDAYVAVCGGKAEEMLKFKVHGHTSSGDYIANMIEQSVEFNFFPRNCKMIDLYARIDAEGRNIVLPYIELKGHTPEITGAALFDNDRMVHKIDVEEAKYMNLMKENGLRGILTVQENEREYISVQGESKRKITCSKENDKYTFNIDVKFKGMSISNTFKENLSADVASKKKFEELLSKDAEKKCYDFINKMKNEYKVDCLELGRIAAAKYGRGTNVNWNEVISNSTITVNVKVEITDTGRGDF